MIFDLRNWHNYNVLTCLDMILFEVNRAIIKHAKNTCFKKYITMTMTMTMTGL